MKKSFYVVISVFFLLFASGCATKKTAPVLTSNQVCNGVESIGVWINSVKAGENNELGFTSQEVTDALKSAMEASRCFRDGNDYTLDVVYGSLAGTYKDGNFIRGDRANYGIVEIRLRFYNALRERIYTGKALIENLKGNVFGMGGIPEFREQDGNLALHNAIRAAIGEAWGENIP